VTAAASGNEKDFAVTEQAAVGASADATPTNGHFSSGAGSKDGGSRDFRNYSSQRSPGGYDRGGFAGQDRPKAGPMEVTVEHNIEKAMRVLKRKLIKEGLFKELKARRYYEKPSERKKRKSKESKKKLRKDEARAKKNPMLLS